MAGARLLLLAGCLLTAVGAQQVTLGNCDYQGDRGFDQDYISELSNEPDGFYFAITSGRLTSCQRIVFLPTGAYVYSYIDEFQVAHNYSGSYVTMSATFRVPGHLTLKGLPVGELGAGIGGEVRWTVLVANNERLLVATCVPIGLFTVEQINGLVPASKYTGNSAVLFKKYLSRVLFPNIERYQEILQTCIPNIRSLTPTFNFLIQLHNFLVTLGLAPPVPFRETVLHPIATDEIKTAVQTETANSNIAYVDFQTFDDSSVPGYTSPPASSLPLSSYTFPSYASASSLLAPYSFPSSISVSSPSVPYAFPSVSASSPPHTFPSAAPLPSAPYNFPSAASSLPGSYTFPSAPSSSSALHSSPSGATSPTAGFPSSAASFSNYIATVPDIHSAPIATHLAQIHPFSHSYPKQVLKINPVKDSPLHYIQSGLEDNQIYSKFYFK